MYGGHITDFWDRRTNAAYLKKLIKPELLSGYAFSGNFKALDPTRSEYDTYLSHIELRLPIESPLMFYLHLNAEISYLTSQGETLFESIFNVQGGTTGKGAAKKDDVSDTLKKYSNQLKEFPQFDLAAIKKKKEKLEPYDIVAIQGIS